MQIVETLARSVRMEMDFRLEAAAAAEYGENLAKDEDFRAPKIDWDRTTREVLTMEWIDGAPLSDPERLAALGWTRRCSGAGSSNRSCATPCATASSTPTCTRAISSSIAQGRIVALDFGIMGRLGRAERRFLAEILYGFITRDYLRVAEVHFEAGYVPRHYRVEDFAQAIRAIGEPIHARPSDQISMARLLTLLFEVTALFDMTTRLELVLLQKTMVVVEGVARKLDPRLNMWATAEPVVGELDRGKPRARAGGWRMRAGSSWRSAAPSSKRRSGSSSGEQIEVEASGRRSCAILPRRSGSLSLLLIWIAIRIGLR